jgi:hypothetical protein
MRNSINDRMKEIRKWETEDGSKYENKIINNYLNNYNKEIIFSNVRIEEKINSRINIEIYYFNPIQSALKPMFKTIWRNSNARRFKILVSHTLDKKKETEIFKMISNILSPTSLIKIKFKQIFNPLKNATIFVKFLAYSLRPTYKRRRPRYFRYYRNYLLRNLKNNLGTQKEGIGKIEINKLLFELNKLNTLRLYPSPYFGSVPISGLQDLQMWEGSRKDIELLWKYIKSGNYIGINKRLLKLIILLNKQLRGINYKYNNKYNFLPLLRKL